MHVHAHKVQTLSTTHHDYIPYVYNVTHMIMKYNNIMVHDVNYIHTVPTFEWEGGQPISIIIILLLNAGNVKANY